MAGAMDEIFGDEPNLSMTERAVSVALGLGIAAAAAQPRPNPWLSLAALAVGVGLAVRGSTGHCPFKALAKGVDRGGASAPTRT